MSKTPETKHRPPRQSNAPITQERFAKLPALLTRAEFRDWSGMSDRHLDSLTITCNGLSDAEMERLREAGLLPVLRNGGRSARGAGYGRYYKCDLARCAGFKL